MREEPRDRRPLSAQVRDRLEDAIREGALRPGERLPGEHELAERLSIGRSTLREALRLLEQDGVIDVRHGKGRFVSALATLKAERPVTEFESVTEMLSGLGYTVRNQVLRVEESRATAVQARALQLRAGARVIVLERLRLARRRSRSIYSLNVIDRDLVGGALSDHDWSSSCSSFSRGSGSTSSRRPPRSAPARCLMLRLWVVSVRLGALVVHYRDLRHGRGSSRVLHAVDYHRGDIFAFHVVRQRSAGRPLAAKKRRRRV